LGRLYLTIARLHVQPDPTSNVIDAAGMVLEATRDPTHRPHRVFDTATVTQIKGGRGVFVPRSAASILDLPNPSKSRLNAVPVPSFPKRNHEHAGREADKRSGEDVTDKMIIPTMRPPAMAAITAA
jgi:hypothetical protein